MPTQTIYSQRDIARDLGVVPSAVTNWMRRYDDFPPPTHETPLGALYWASIEPWRTWYQEIQIPRQTYWQSRNLKKRADIQSRAAIDRARKLHQPENGCDNPVHTVPDATCPQCCDYCQCCGEAMPCATIRAIDGEDSRFPTPKAGEAQR